MLIAVLTCGLITLVLGVAAGLPGFPLDLAQRAAESLLGPPAWK